MSDFKTILRGAVEKAGSQKALADAMGITQQGVSYLLNDAENISAELAIAVERATGGEVKRADLRPDLFASAA